MTRTHDFPLLPMSFHEFPPLEQLVTGQTGSRLMVWEPRFPDPFQSNQSNQPNQPSHVDQSVWLEICDKSVRLAFGEAGKLQAGARFEFPGNPIPGSTPSKITFDGPWFKDRSNTALPPTKKDFEILCRLVWMAQSSAASGKLEIAIDGEALRDLRSNTETEEFANETIQVIDELAIKIFGAKNKADVKNADDVTLVTSRKGPPV